MKDNSSERTTAVTVPPNEPKAQPATADAVSATPTISQVEIRAWIIEALAEVRAIEPEVIRQEIVDADGDLEIDSKEGEVIVALLEARLGRELPGPADLEPEEYTSIEALVRLIERKLQEPDGEVDTAGHTPAED